MKACIKNENKALQIMIYHLIKVKRLRAAFIPSEALVATKMHSRDLIFIPQVQDGSLQSKKKKKRWRKSNAQVFCNLLLHIFIWPSHE